MEFETASSFALFKTPSLSLLAVLGEQPRFIEAHLFAPTNILAAEHSSSSCSAFMFFLGAQCVFNYFMRTLQ
jgi:hypothetical protein